MRPSSPRDESHPFRLLRISCSEASEKRDETISEDRDREEGPASRPDVTIGVFLAHFPFFRSSPCCFGALSGATTLAPRELHTSAVAMLPGRMRGAGSPWRRPPGTGGPDAARHPGEPSETAKGRDVSRETFVLVSTKRILLRNSGSLTFGCSSASPTLVTSGA